MPTVYNPPVNTYVALQTVTLGSPTTSITFSSIPNTYKDLVIKLDWQSTDGNDYLFGQFNNDTGNNYNRLQMGTFNGGNSVYSGPAEAYISLNPPYGSTGGISIMHIMNYANTSMQKTILGRSKTSSSTFVYVQRWTGTAAINSIKIILSGGGAIGSGAVISLYGVGS